MAFVCDAHVHIYPSYDLSSALISAERNLLNRYQEARCLDSTLPPIPAQIFISLAERYDCTFFADLSAGKIILPANYKLLPQTQEGLLSIELPSRQILHLIAGRQIVTSERLEILCFGSDAPIRDVQPFSDVVSQVREHGGLAVLNWAPGKWLFSRSPLVEKIISEAEVGSLLLCDTTLRPLFWMEPLLMRKGRAIGLGVIAGSDPLPLPNEELRIGQYGIVMNQPLPVNSELEALKILLSKPAPALLTVGKRSSPIDVGWRIFKHFKALRADV